MSAITEQITIPGSYELVQSKVLATLQADTVLTAVVKSFVSELPDENKQFGTHEIPRISCLTERKDQQVDSDGMARIESYQVAVIAYHQGFELSELVTDAQRLAAYVELLLEAEGNKSSGMSGLDSVIDGAEGSLIIGAVSTQYYAGQLKRGNAYQVESQTSCEIILTRPLLG